MASRFSSEEIAAAIFDARARPRKPNLLDRINGRFDEVSKPNRPVPLKEALANLEFAGMTKTEARLVGNTVENFMRHKVDWIRSEQMGTGKGFLSPALLTFDPEYYLGMTTHSAETEPSANADILKGLRASFVEMLEALMDDAPDEAFVKDHTLEQRPALNG